MEPNDCDGDGFCLKRGFRGYNNNGCPHKCAPIECPNFIVCGAILPKCITFCYNGTCMNCASIFGGKLTFKEKVECPICLDEKPGVKQINCSHMVCNECFKRCTFGSRLYMPIFPYSIELEEEYERKPNDPKWNTQLIANYKQQLAEYELLRDETFKKESGLRVCGICRR